MTAGPTKPGSGQPLDDDLEREIAEALGDTSLLGMDAPRSSRARTRDAFERRLDEVQVPGEAATAQRRTGLRKGIITHVGRDDVFVEFGPREQGVVPLAHFAENPDVGTSLQVHVDAWDGKQELYLCSLQRGVQDADWASVEKGAILMGQVTGTNKGGLELRVGELSAFLPACQASLERVERLESLVGQSFPVEVTEVDRERRRIVVSRRGLLAREREEKRAGAARALLPGTATSGRVTKVEPFGCFVDLGGVEGLVHVSQMAWTRVEKPEEVVKAGDQVKVQVLEVSPDGKRISLSMKALLPDPWVTWTAEHAPGSLVEGTVTRVASYGAFLEVAAGIEGLAHVSQLAPGGARSARDAVHVGQKVTVRVVSVDAGQRRIALSLLGDGGERLGDDVADRATVREVLERTRAAQRQPTLGDLLKKALEQAEKRPPRSR
ncbi:MAG: 30S ribosomal protein S1 [Planctomycetia bacterium]